MPSSTVGSAGSRKRTPESTSLNTSSTSGKCVQAKSAVSAPCVSYSFSMDCKRARMEFLSSFLSMAAASPSQGISTVSTSGCAFARYFLCEWAEIVAGVAKTAIFFASSGSATFMLILMTGTSPSRKDGGTLKEMVLHATRIIFTSFFRRKSLIASEKRTISSTGRSP